MTDATNILEFEVAYSNAQKTDFTIDFETEYNYCLAKIKKVDNVYTVTSITNHRKEKVYLDNVEQIEKELIEIIENHLLREKNFSPFSTKTVVEMMLKELEKELANTEEGGIVWYSKTGEIFNWNLNYYHEIMELVKYNEYISYKFLYNYGLDKAIQELRERYENDDVNRWTTESYGYSSMVYNLAMLKLNKFVRVIRNNTSYRKFKNKQVTKPIAEKLVKEIEVYLY